MNNFQLYKLRLTSEFTVIAFITLLLSSCADTGLVSIEAPIEQLQNLKDNDSDGVILARERCIGTVHGANVDNYGCGTQTPHIEPLRIDIKFAHNSALIPNSAYPKIKELAGFLDKHQELQVLIEGHTSKVGGTEHNKKLSVDRAKTLSLVLVNDFNIAQQRISSVGYGAERPEDNNDTQEAHGVNRRIIAELSHTEQIDEMMWTIYTVDNI